jgi:hypothetical protein
MELNKLDAFLKFCGYLFIGQFLGVFTVLKDIVPAVLKSVIQ